MRAEGWPELGSRRSAVVVLSGVVAATMWLAAPAMAQERALPVDSVARTPLQTDPGRDTIPLDTIRVRVASRVSSRLPVLTRSVQALDRVAIEALPARTVADALGWATGVDVAARSPAQSDLSVRGGSFEQVVVLVDGVRVSDPQTGHFDLDLAVPLDRVHRIEVLRGPASALYGADAMGGVVNVVTRDDGGWRARVEGGAWGTARVSLSGGFQHDDGLGLHAGGELSRSDGHRPGTDHDMALGQLGLRHPLAGGVLSAALGVARRDFGAKDFYAPFPSYERTRTYTSGVRWTSGPAPARLELGASYRRHDDDFTLVRDDPSIYRNRHTSSQAGADVLFRAAVVGDLAVAAGAELFGDALASESLGDRSELRGAVFGEAVVGRGGPGVLSLGLRQDWHERFGSVLSPSLSASYRLGPTRLRGALGRSYRAPTWTERYYRDPANVGRADLAPERAWSAEAGADVRLGGTVRFAATAFVRRAEGLIDWARDVAAPDTVPWQTRNVETAVFHGAEADVEGAGPLQTRWSLGAMVLSVDAREAAGFVSKYALRPLEERVTVDVRRAFGKRARLGIRALRARRADEVEPHHLLDLRAAVAVAGAWLYLDATNLLDAHYPDVTGALAPGRAVFVGVELGR